MSEGEFIKRITYLKNADIREPMKSAVITGLFGMIEDAKKEIFPIPLGDLPINPITGQRDIIIHGLGEWGRFINAIRKWLGEAK